MPYLSMRSYKLCLPRHVCLGPSIAINVPTGSTARVSGTKVTLVWSLKDLVRVSPCLAFLPIDHPSFCKSLISCPPVITRDIKELIYRRRNRLDMGAIKRFSSEWAAPYDIFYRSCTKEFYRMFSKKPFSLTHFFKSIQVKQYCFLNLFFSLWNRTTERSRTEFLAIRCPSSTFFSKLKIDNNIAGCWHWFTSFCEGTGVFNIVFVYYITICQEGITKRNDYNIKLLLSRTNPENHLSPPTP